MGEEEEDDFEGENEDLDKEESEPDSDTEELRRDELEEFWNANVDCTSGNIVFIDDSGETTDGDQSLDTRCVTPIPTGIWIRVNKTKSR